MAARLGGDEFVLLLPKAGMAEATVFAGWPSWKSVFEIGGCSRPWTHEQVG